MEFLTAYKYTLEYRKGSPNCIADLLCRLPLPATEYDATSMMHLTPPDDTGVKVVHCCGIQMRDSLTPDDGLGELVPLVTHRAWGGICLIVVRFR